MTEVSYEAVRSKAHELHESKADWHFHILTPECALNDQERYAFVVEQVEPPASWVYFSGRVEKELDQELLPLLHGDEVMNHEATSTSYQPSDVVSSMVKRASELNEQGTEWHHHMLFPGCQLNTHPGQFALVFEDPQTKVALESVTDHEPINDLKQIEPLFVGKANKL